MKRLIRWLLNHIPRRWLQRMAGWAVPIVGLAYKGHGRECPIATAALCPTVMSPHAKMPSVPTVYPWSVTA